MFRLLLALFSLALISTAGAAPMTLKEVDFLLRQQTPEEEILRQLTARRLVAAPDAATEKVLASHGATSRLLTSLKDGALLLQGEEAQAFHERSMQQQDAAARQVAADRAALEERKRAAASHDEVTHENVADRLLGKLVSLRGDELKPFDTAALRDVRVFGFYTAGAGSKPSRDFTAKLMEFYRGLKVRHPDFELIFVSADRDEFNMSTFMRTQQIVCPAVRFGEQAVAQRYTGDTLPWLSVVFADGRPVTQNLIDHKYIDPEQILPALEKFLDGPH